MRQISPKCENCNYYCHEDITDGFVCVNSDSEHVADWVEADNVCEVWESAEEKVK